MAYTQVAEWINEPGEHDRPRPDILDLAKEHSRRLGDDERIAEIEAVENENVRKDSIATPRPFASPVTQKSCDQESEIKVFKPTGTSPFDRNSKIKQAIIIGDNLPDADDVDALLDNFIRSFT